VCTQRIDEGIEAAQRAAQLQPVDAEARYTHGYALAAGQRWTEAISELDAAMGLNPSHHSCRQTLIYSLLEQGKALASTDYRAAETCIDRAYKLNQRNPAAFVALLQILYDTRQKPKAIKLIMEADPGVKGNADAAAVIAKVEADQEFAIALKQAQVQSNPVAAPAKPVHAGPKQIHCPQCKLLIAEFAAICPHCNFRIRQVGTFAGRDVGPDYNWQDVAFTIVSIIWCLVAAFDIYAGLQSTLAGYFVWLGGARLVIGIGMLFRNDLAMTIAKYLCYLTLLTSAMGTVVNFALGQYLFAAIQLFLLGMAGFLVYLLNWVGD